MADVKMPEFRSDVVFEDNVTIEDTLTTSQIIEKGYCPSIIASDTSGFSNYNYILEEDGSVIGLKNLVFSWIGIKPQPISKSLSDIEIVKCILINLSGTTVCECAITRIEETSSGFRYDVMFPESRRNMLSVTPELTIKYAISYSYLNKQKLYEEDGALYNIQKRLDNLESNIKQLSAQDILNIKVPKLQITEKITTPAIAHGYIKFNEYFYTTKSESTNSFSTNRLDYIIQDIHQRLISIGV